MIIRTDDERIKAYCFVLRASSKLGPNPLRRYTPCPQLLTWEIRLWRSGRPPLGLCALHLRQTRYDPEVVDQNRPGHRQLPVLKTFAAQRLA